jgi:hypothetical protein
MKKSAVRHRHYWQVAVLATCLMLAQALWLLHRVVHFEVLNRASVAQASASLKSPVGDLVVSPWAKALLPDHQDERSCADYDQLGHADMAPGCAAPTASQAPAMRPEATHVASGMAAQAAGFLARGPPATA